MSEVAVSKTFEQKMEEKIKESIGEMMESEDLKKIIERGIELAFFKQKEIKDGYRTLTVDSFLIECIRQNMDKLVAQEIEKRFDADKEKFQSLIEKTLEKDVFELFAKGFNQMFSHELSKFKGAIGQKLGSYNISIY